MVLCTAVVPIRNEPNISQFLLELHKILAADLGTYEILVVIGDRETLHPDIPSLPHQKIIKTYGDSLERSILNGFSSTKSDKIVVCDADGCHPIERIPKMFYLLDKYEMVIGSRYIEGGRSDLGPFRNFVSSCFKTWAHLFGSKLSDPMAGFFAVRKEVIDKVKFKPFTWKTCLEIEMKARPEFTEIPIVAKQRTDSGVSKTSVKIGLKLMWDIFKYKVIG